MVKIVQNCISLKNVKTNKKLYCKVKTKVKSVRIGENYLVFTYFSPTFHLVFTYRQKYSFLYKKIPTEGEN